MKETVIAEWPGRVIPRTDSEIAHAAHVLCARAGWPSGNRDLGRLLEGWFAAGWCVDALIVALDRTPDGGCQRPWSGKGDLTKHVARRLRPWFVDAHSAAGISTPRTPPIPGITLDQWWDISRRNREQTAVRPHRPLTSTGKVAREQIRRRVAVRRTDPLQRIRDRDTRYRATLDALLPPSAAASQAVVPVVSDAPAVDDYPARRKIIANDPAVRRALDIARATPGPLTPAAAQILRNAISTARHNLGLDALKGAAAPVDDQR